MNTVFRITLDIHKIGSQAVIPCFQGDSGYTIIARLTENGMPFAIEDSCKAFFQAKKPDGNVLDNICVIDNNTIVYDFLTTVKDGETCQTTAVEGSVDCQFKLIGANGGILASPLFKIVVSKGVYDEGEVLPSVSEATAFSEMVADMEAKKNSGYFNGEKGEKGDKGDPGDSGVQMEEVLDSLFPAYEDQEDITSQASWYQLPSDNAKILFYSDNGYIYICDENYNEPMLHFKDGATSPYLLPDDIENQEAAANFWKAGNYFEGIGTEAAYLITTKEQEDKTALSPSRMAAAIDYATEKKTVCVPVARKDDYFSITDEMRENGLIVRVIVPPGHSAGGFYWSIDVGNLDNFYRELYGYFEEPNREVAVTLNDDTSATIGRFSWSDGDGYGGTVELLMPITMECISKEKLAAFLGTE